MVASNIGPLFLADRLRIGHFLNDSLRYGTMFPPLYWNMCRKAGVIHMFYKCNTHKTPHMYYMLHKWLCM